MLEMCPAYHRTLFHLRGDPAVAATFTNFESFDRTVIDFKIHTCKGAMLVCLQSNGSLRATDVQISTNRFMDGE